MSQPGLSRQQKHIHLSLLVISACLLLFATGFTGVFADKTPTNLTIEINPPEPAIDEGFHVTGYLKTAEGKPLGNKVVVLETSPDGGKSSDGFAVITNTQTDRDGGYTFFRQKDYPPEFLRVRYAGNAEFAPAVSDALPVRGAGTDHPQVQIKTGSIKIVTSPDGADIYIDEVHKGTTPTTIGNLSEGSHTLRVTKKGYQDETMETYVTSKIDNALDIALSKEVKE
ncbi:MAG: PEGA domain-containing protein [Methanospirillum sp.]|nr:PEGA domain-containing protein [Methanospirillum sp.]